MMRFSLDKKNMFIGKPRSDDGVVVWETNALYQTKLLAPNWTKITAIGDDCPYNELEVHGVVISGEMLKLLGNDLREHNWAVNCEGLIYTIGEIETKLGIYNMRLHDFFGWSRYGVQVPEVTTLWNKYDLYTNRLVIDIETAQKSTLEYESRVEDLETQLKECKALLEEKEMKLAFYEKKSVDVEVSPLLKVLKEKDEEMKVMSNHLFAAAKQAEAIKTIADSMMVTFSLNAKKLFITQGKHERVISVWENNDLYEIKVQQSNWKLITEIGDGCGYNGLEVHGVVITGEMLKELVQDLQEHDWIVNNEGLMYMRGWVKTKLGIFNKRLHDFFGWSKYGVQVPEITTLWKKYELYNNSEIATVEITQESETELEAESDTGSEEDSKVKELGKELRECKAELQEKESQLSAYEKIVKENELDVKLLCNQLFAAQKQVESIKTVTDSLLTYLKEANPQSGLNFTTTSPEI